MEHISRVGLPFNEKMVETLVARTQRIEKLDSKTLY